MRAILLDGHLYATAELAEKLAPWPVVVCDEWEIEQLQGEGYAGMCLRLPKGQASRASLHGAAGR